jgi:hypothetical protein
MCIVGRSFKRSARLPTDAHMRPLLRDADPSRQRSDARNALLTKIESINSAVAATAGGSCLSDSGAKLRQRLKEAHTELEALAAPHRDTVAGGSSSAATVQSHPISGVQADSISASQDELLLSAADTSGHGGADELTASLGGLSVSGRAQTTSSAGVASKAAAKGVCLTALNPGATSSAGAGASSVAMLKGPTPRQGNRSTGDGQAARGAGADNGVATGNQGPIGDGSGGLMTGRKKMIEQRARLQAQLVALRVRCSGLCTFVFIALLLSTCVEACRNLLMVHGLV